MSNAVYAQSGGMTPVINNTATAVIRTCRKYSDKINTLYASRNGILGILEDKLIDTTKITEKDLKYIENSPGGVFGSCRYKLKNIDEDYDTYEKIYENLKKYNIKYIFYNGGNDSADTSNKLSIISKFFDYDIICIGIPKTIDNDLPHTDVCPGFPSAAKYIATSLLEMTIDVKSMFKTSTKVVILEIMGRNAGWLTAASSVWKKKESDAPHICLLPEVTFNEEHFLSLVRYFENKYGYCSIAVSEGIKNKNNEFLNNKSGNDSFGHKQLGGVGNYLSDLITNVLKYKCHLAIPDYLQRSCRHISPPIDIELAKKVGEKAVEFAIDGLNNIMPIIIRKSDKPYKYEINYVKLSTVANIEKKIPKNFIKENGYEITSECKEYLRPFVIGNSETICNEEGKPIFFDLDEF